LKTVINRVIEITSKRTQIFHGAQTYVSPSSLGPRMLEAWKPGGGVRITGRIKMAESSIFLSFPCEYVVLGICNVSGETSEGLEGVFPGGVINHGKNLLKRFYSLCKLRGPSKFSGA